MSIGEFWHSCQASASQQPGCGAASVRLCGQGRRAIPDEHGTSDELDAVRRARQALEQVRQQASQAKESAADGGRAPVGRRCGRPVRLGGDGRDSCEGGCFSPHAVLGSFARAGEDSVEAARELIPAAVKLPAAATQAAEQIARIAEDPARLAARPSRDHPWEGRVGYAESADNERRVCCLPLGAACGGLCRHSFNLCAGSGTLQQLAGCGGGAARAGARTRLSRNGRTRGASALSAPIATAIYALSKRMWSSCKPRRM